MQAGFGLASRERRPARSRMKRDDQTFLQSAWRCRESDGGIGTPTARARISRTFPFVSVVRGRLFVLVVVVVLVVVRSFLSAAWPLLLVRSARFPYYVLTPASLLR